MPLTFVVPTKCLAMELRILKSPFLSVFIRVLFPLPTLMKVEIYSDIACPWCYIGERRFEAALAGFRHADQVEVVFRPYQLNPDASRTPAPLVEELRAKFGPQSEAMLRHVGTAARGEGIAMNWEKAVAINTHTAHRLLRLAEKEYGAEAQRRLMEKLFEAYFTNGGNVADHALLADLAVAAGLDRERVESYLATEEGLAELEAELEHARRIGVRAVPTFVFEGEQAVEGAQPASTFLQVLEQIHGELAPSNTGSDAADACADGACAV